MKDIDNIESQSDTSTQTQANEFKKVFEQLYAIETDLRCEKVSLNILRPTQHCIHAYWLQVCENKLKNGLVEPIIVIKTGNRYILLQGHHRAIAAINLACNEIDSYVIDLNRDLKLGTEKAADKMGIYSFDDVEIIFN